jgi:N-acetylmuramoyl-L-alanine amidase
MLADQIRLDMQSLNGSFEYNWTTDTTNTDSHIDFGEINLGTNAEMDATIIEVAYHDNLQDNALLRDPKVRDQIARNSAGDEYEPADAADQCARCE